MDDANYKNSNDLETTHNHLRRQPTVVPSTSSQDFKGSTGHEEYLFNKNLEASSSHDHEVIIGKASFLNAEDQGGHEAERSSTCTSPPLAPAPPAAGAAVQPEGASGKMVVTEEEEEEISTRERLKRHRVEVSSSGKLWIPDTWGQEDLLKNWIDCTVFDSSLDKTTIMLAREALIQDVGRST